MSTRIVHERYHSASSTVAVPHTNTHSKNTTKLVKTPSAYPPQSQYTLTSTSTTPLSDSPLKASYISSETPTLHSYCSNSSLRTMENTTNYSIDTNSTTCHSQMETPIQLIGISKSNSSSNSNSVGQLDTKVPLSKQPSIQDKFLFTQQNQQSQQSQQQYQIEQQRSHQQKRLNCQLYIKICR